MALRCAVRGVRMAASYRLLVAATAYALTPGSPPGGRKPRTKLEQRGLTPADGSTLELGSDLARASILKSNAGCWSGWEVSFCPRTGKALPLDEAYLPEELREWGPPPLGWETFCLDGADGSIWTRSGFRILPEAGCAADEVAASTFSWGLDLSTAFLRATTEAMAVDAPKYPSGECGAAATGAPPFVEVRTVFFGAGPRV